MPKLNLKIPIVNACGTGGSYLDAFKLFEEKGACFGAWIPKSIGPFSSNPELREKYGWGEEKLGNPNPTIVHTGHAFLNSFALPTPPVESCINEFEESKLEKPTIGSVYGFKAEDYAVLIGMVDKYVDAWELNVSCPNKEKGEESLMEFITSEVESIVKPLRNFTEKPIIAKLSHEDYVTLAEIVKNHVDYIGCGNTIGPGLVIDIYSKKPVLGGIYGGMSGAAIKPLTVKMVNDVYKVVKKSGVEIIAYGGIENWGDIIEYALAGASIFGLGTETFLKVVDGKAIQRNTDEVVKLSNDIWRGVQKHLKERRTTLDKLVGSAKI